MSEVVGIFNSKRGAKVEHVEPYQFTVREEPIVTKSGIVVAGRRAIIREDKNEVLGTVGSNYKVLTHAKALDPILNHFEKKKIKAFRRIALTENGARMYANVYFPDNEMSFNSPEGKNDRFWPGLTVVNSLDGTLKYHIEETIYRLACTNGVRVPHVVASVRTSHSKNKNFEHLIDEILNGSMDFTKFSVFNAWAGIPLTTDKMISVAEKIAKKSTFPERYLDLVLLEVKKESETGVATIWGLYNAFNSVLEHHMIRAKGKLERSRMLEDNVYKTFLKEFKTVTVS